MRRHLILDEDDLVLVVKQDVVQQIDENRGELNRTEFVNYLIQCQLKECDNQPNYITRSEFQEFAQDIKDLMRNFLQFFFSCGIALDKQPPYEDLEAISQQLELLDNPDEETEEL